MLLGHGGVDAGLIQQLLVAALFDDRSLAQDAYAIATHDRADPVADEHDRVPAFERVQRFVDDPFVFSVKQGRLEARAQALPEHKPSSVFERVGDDVYRTVSGREAGELLRVTRDADGKVTKMNWATYLVTREPLAFGEWL